MQRLQNLYNQIGLERIKILKGDALKIVDHRTKKYYEVTLKESKDCYFIKTKDLAKITNLQDQPLRIYDPGYVNTICNTSKISYIDGIRGRLQYRGYKIQQLAAKSNYLQVSFLLMFGELPSQDQQEVFVHNVMSNRILHDSICDMIKTTRHDAHPMGVLISTLNAFSTLQPDINGYQSDQNMNKNIAARNTHIYKLLGVIPTLVANIYRHKMGKPFIMPKQNSGYVQNLLYMLDSNPKQNYIPHPKLVKALEILFIVYAEHEMNCSTSLVRHIASSGVNIYTICSIGACALYGPKHGAANAEVISMLESIGSKNKIRKFLMEVKMKKRKLYGFGNRIYKNFDPRAKIIQKIASDVFEICGKEPLIQIALQLERTALQDDFFITRKLYPNADFYSGLIYRALGFDKSMYSVIYAIPRISGWVAHWIQFLNDRENNIYRPRQNYTGYGRRQFIEFSERKEHNFEQQTFVQSYEKRRAIAKKHEQQKGQ